MSKNANNNYLRKKVNIYTINSIIIFFTMLLITTILSQKSYAISFDLEGSIPADIFELNGLSQGSVIEDEWSFKAGEITEDKLPSFNKYIFVNATVNNTPIKYLGIAKKENDEILYYYLTDTESEENISATILPNDTKIVLNYEKSEFKITYNIIGDTDGISKESVFGTNPRTTTVNQSYSFDVNIPAGYTAKVYRNGEEITHGNYPLGTEPIYTRNGNIITPDTSDGRPSSLVLKDTFYDNNVTEDRNIEVVLTFNTSTLTFDAHYWLNTDYAKRSWYIRNL